MGDSGKVRKTHEITMEYGNFSYVFFVKTCSIISARKNYMGMEGRGIFQKSGFCFHKGYLHFFFFSVQFFVGPTLFFVCFFLPFAKVSFKKRRFLITVPSKVKSKICCLL
eukprot:UN24661